MAAPIVRRAPATEADYDALPETTDIIELVDGEIVAMPRPEAQHTGTASDLGALLAGWFRFGQGGGPGGWRILDEPDLRLGSNRLIPDLAGWRRERFVRPRKGPYTLVPDWVCEVLSPSTMRHDRVRKMPRYASGGVRHLWLADPVACVLEVYRLEGERWLHLASHGARDVVRAEPFDAVELDLALVWEVEEPGDDPAEPPGT